MDPKIVDLYDEFKRGGLDRREFLRKLASLAGGTAAASALLPLLEARPEASQSVPKDDPGLRTQYINYAGATGDIRAYSARPKDAQKRPGVVVIHENRGLNAHIEDVARRVAKEGYLALAPDALSPFGGTPANPDEARPLFQKLDTDANIKNFVAAVRYLKTDPQSTGKVACMGFCWGGGMTNQVAVHSPDLAAAVPFYGMQPAPADVPKIKAAMLIHYAGNDERINGGIPAFEETLKNASVDYKIFMYPGAEHSFFNDTNPAPRYNKEAAELAWKRTLEFFKKKLRG
ncbi:MAG: dienelactone hydrolase family protein [Candidatus Aminicenantales bacterium]